VLLVIVVLAVEDVMLTTRMLMDVAELHTHAQAVLVVANKR
jgi:hypothetical protein